MFSYMSHFDGENICRKLNETILSENCAAVEQNIIREEKESINTTLQAYIHIHRYMEVVHQHVCLRYKNVI